MKIIDPELLKTITLDQTMTVATFVEELRMKTNKGTITSATIHYHLNNTEMLDYIVHQGIILIVINDKSRNFTPGDNYGAKRVRRDTFTTE